MKILWYLQYFVNTIHKQENRFEVIVTKFVKNVNTNDDIMARAKKRFTQFKEDRQW